MGLKKVFKNALIVNEGKEFQGHLLVESNIIVSIHNNFYEINAAFLEEAEIIDCSGKILIPGVIDDQVHFREPGLTEKADIYSESKAAVAGGVTSFMEMPNTNPQTTTQIELQKKYDKASEVSLANYSFYMGATNENIDEILQTDPKTVCGLKVFMGSSTGNMLVNDAETLKNIFEKSPLLIATHCEDESTIQANLLKAKQLFGDDIPFSQHPVIRDETACYLSSSLAVKLAKKYNSRLHVLHLTTAKEMELFSNNIPLKEKKITSEVCVHHLWFNEQAYKEKGSLVKWNPAIKSEKDRIKLFESVLDDTIDVIATDHAPHQLSEKQNPYLKAPSGGPLVQHSLQVMLEFYHQKKISLTHIVKKMCHDPADCFSVEKRGFLRPGYFADIVLVDLHKKNIVSKNNIYYKCQWSPFEGTEFNSSINSTFVGGNLVYKNGIFNEKIKGSRLSFER